MVLVKRMQTPITSQYTDVAKDELHTFMFLYNFVLGTYTYILCFF
jgi:hypothetical protein